MKTLVIKFGGSSLADPVKIRRAAGALLAARRRGLSPVAVVSAPADVTDDLLKLGTLSAGRVLPPREADALMAAGEQASAALVAMAVAAEGGKAVSLTGAQAGILTNASFSSASVLSVNPRRLKKELRAGRIPVVAGFQGATREGEIATLGRGGSDLTAVVLADALGRVPCEFRTDVKGIYTAHPAAVPEARKIKELSYAEVLKLAELGTEVRQLHAVACAEARGISLHLRSAFHEEPGTLVTIGKGRRGISCLSLKKSGRTATVSAIGARLAPADSARAAAAAGERPASAGANFISFRVPPASADDLLRRLHAALFR